MTACSYPQCKNTSPVDETKGWFLADEYDLCPVHRDSCTHKCFICQEYFTSLFGTIPYKWGYYAGSWFCPKHWIEHIPEPNRESKLTLQVWTRVSTVEIGNTRVIIEHRNEN